MPSRPPLSAPLALAVALAAAALPGCGGSGSKATTVPAQGRLLYQGKPLAGALVVFVPDEPQKAPDGSEVPNPSATTGDDGSFTVQTYEPADGLPVGSYRVKVSSAPAPSADNGMLRPRTKAELTDVLKGRYLDPQKSGLTARITAGPNTIPPFELK